MEYNSKIYDYSKVLKNVWIDYLHMDGCFNMNKNYK